MFLILFNFFWLTSLFNRIDTVFTESFCKIDHSIESFWKKLVFNKSILSLCTRIDAISRKILCENNLCYKKNLFKPNFFFQSLLYTLFHDIFRTILVKTTFQQKRCCFFLDSSEFSFLFTIIDTVCRFFSCKIQLANRKIFIKINFFLHCFRAPALIRSSY